MIWYYGDEVRIMRNLETDRIEVYLGNPRKHVLELNSRDAAHLAMALAKFAIEIQDYKSKVSSAERQHEILKSMMSFGISPQDLNGFTIIKEEEL